MALGKCLSDLYEKNNVRRVRHWKKEGKFLGKLFGQCRYYSILNQMFNFGHWQSSRWPTPKNLGMFRFLTWVVVTNIWSNIVVCRSICNVSGNVCQCHYHILYSVPLAKKINPSSLGVWFSYYYSNFGRHWQPFGLRAALLWLYTLAVVRPSVSTLW